MRKLVLLSFLIMVAGLLSGKSDSALTSTGLPTASGEPLEVLDVFKFDLSSLISAEGRSRSSSTSSQRLKNDRIFGFIDLPGLVFYTCRIEKSYSETSVDKFLKLLFQFTIQVNAP